MGSYSYANGKSEFSYTEIGRYCSIGQECMIGVRSHPLQHMSTHPFIYSRKYPSGRPADLEARGPAPVTTIGHDVWIGARVLVLAGVRIGNGAVIGAQSVVTRDVEPYSIVVGAPARHVRYRLPPDQIQALQDLAWWEFDLPSCDTLSFVGDIPTLIEQIRSRVATGEIRRLPHQMPGDPA